MEKELKNFANFVLGKLLDLYMMKDWGCDFETFKTCLQEKITDECKRWQMEEE